MPELETISIHGFKSIAVVEKLNLGAINVVIGPNGSGQSNFVGVFSFLHSVREGHLAQKFQAIRDQFTNPEESNDSPTTAPSKRVQKLVPGYEKPLLGTLAVIEIGLDRIRAECPHFRYWIERLETLLT